MSEPDEEERGHNAGAPPPEPSSRSRPGRSVDPDPREPVESPPEGSTCGLHPESLAYAVCPRCGGYACLSCWHPSVHRCHDCVIRDPAAAAPPMPWEPRPTLSGFFGTLASALTPAASAPAFARGGVGPARTFFLLSFVPLAMLSGLIPFTRTLLFHRFTIDRLAAASDAEVALDVARSLGLGLLYCGAMWLGGTLPYVSLTRSYAGPRAHPPAAERTMLYRGFLIPACYVLLSVGHWGLDQSSPGGAVIAIWSLSMLPLFLLLSTMLSSARMGGGLTIAPAIVTVFVAFALMLGVGEFLKLPQLMLWPTVESAGAAP